MYLNLIILLSLAVDPPIWPQKFSQSFVQKYGQDEKKYISGKMWYDSTQRMSRFDRTDGQYQALCASLLPDVQTPCLQLVRDAKRYIIFPEKSQCCLCCDQAHGCGILSRNWLKNATYEGRQELQDQQFDKWSKLDGDATDYYWATINSAQIPRKIDQGGKRIEDFLLNTYDNTTDIPDTVFELPSYCNSVCPDSSVCGKFRTS